MWRNEAGKVVVGIGDVYAVEGDCGGLMDEGSCRSGGDGGRMERFGVADRRTCVPIALVLK